MGGLCFGLAIKLKKLKEKIKEWIKNHFGDTEAAKSKLLAGIQNIGRKEEHSQLSEAEISRR